MKVNVEVDCTPEEMRRLMGLPDLTPVHERYVAMMADAVGGVRPESVEKMVAGWAPMGEAGLAFWRRLMESGTKPE